MPIIPCSGASLWTRHRKSCACSSALGCLKEVTRHPCGLTLSITFLIVPSLPLVSIPCTTSKTAWLRGVAQLLQLAQLRLQRPQLRLPLLRPTPSVWRVEVPRMGGAPGPASRRIPFGGALTRRPGKQRTIDGHAVTHNMRATVRGDAAERRGADPRGCEGGRPGGRGRVRPG